MIASLLIGGEAVGKRSLAQWRQLLRESPVGTRIVVRYRRGSDQHAADLVLADRIPATAFNTIPTQPSP
jgi:hypothetical protein